MNFKDIISIAAVIATTVVAVVSIFLNHRSNLLADIGDINFTNDGQTEVQAKEKFDRYFIFTKLNETRLTETK